MASTGQGKDTGPGVPTVPAGGTGAVPLPPHHAHRRVPALQALTSCSQHSPRILRSQLIPNLLSLPPPAPSVRLLQAAKPEPGA